VTKQPRVTTEAAVHEHARRNRTTSGWPTTDARPFDHDGQHAGWTWACRRPDGQTFGWTLTDGRTGYDPTPDCSPDSWRREAPKRAAISAILGEVTE